MNERVDTARSHGSNVAGLPLLPSVAVVLLLVLSGAIPLALLPNAAAGAPAALPAAGGAPGVQAALPHRDLGPSTALPPSGASPQLSATAHLSGRPPNSWQGRTVPPGAPLVRPGGPGRASSWGSNGPNSSGLSQYCYGVWPSEGNQSTYLPNCYGHDEPGINPYSTLPGSGGNVTWNVTLPTDRSPTLNQSDLYTAIWFGMVLTDPYAWMDECFLELQFYPDSAWPGTSVSPNGNWIGAAVAWQIEASTGYENACFYQELGPDPLNGSYLNMHQGDRVQVGMSGWTGSPYGENLTISDLTNGQSTRVNLYNHTLGYPLDPSYRENDVPNALHWTPGGQLSVSFAFENGHTTAPFPNNNSYGGCSSGVPPSTATDPAVPCPSYDPGSWANDTFSPWEIPPPVFSNGTARSTSTQFGFSQDLGGLSLIDPLSNGTCTGRDGSAWCSYPWWSYACSAQAFEFGATDYSAASLDFGKYDQYATRAIQDGVGNGYYPITNASLPACAKPSATLTIQLAPYAGGTVHFLGRTLLPSSVPTTTTFTGLLPGNYSLSANVSTGPSFGAAWRVTGSARVRDPTSPWTSLELDGNATLAVVLGTGASTPVAFTDLGGHGWQALSRGTAYASPGAVTTIPTNGSVNLSAGVYSLLAYPRPGFEFSHWVVSGTNASVAAPDLPFTWLNVSGGAPTVAVEADFVASPVHAWVYVYTSGSGSVVLNGTPYSSGYSAVYLSAGTYPVAYVPSAGSTIGGYYLYGSALSIGQDSRLNVTFEGGVTYLYGYFVTLANVTFLDQPSNGTISFADTAPVANGTTVPDPLYNGPVFQDLVALAPPNMTFSHWAVGSAAAAWVLAPGQAATSVEVNTSTSITAVYASRPGGPLHFAVSAGAAGAIRLDYASRFTNGSTLLWATNSTHVVEGIVPANFTCLGFSADSGATVSYPLGPTVPCFAVVQLAATGTTVTLRLAAYPSAPVPVTFVAYPPNVQGRFDGVGVSTGSTLELAAGNHALSASATQGTVGAWTTTANLSVVSNGSGGWTLVVHGPGTVYAFPPGQLQAQIQANPTTGTVPLLVGFSANALGGSPPYAYGWNFADGGTATGVSVNHTFTQPGTFVVHLWVNDSASASYLVTTTVVAVPSPLAASISVSPPRGEAPANVTLTATAVGGVPSYGYAWSYGDGFGGVGRVVVHEYASPGTYPVVLQVNDALGATVQASANVVLVVGPTVTIAVSGNGAAAPANVSLSATVAGGEGPFHYTWTFGDGSGGTGSSVSHQYAAQGTYDARVNVTDALGGIAASSASVVVLPAISPLTAQLTIAPSSVHRGESVTLIATTSGGNGSNTYTWTHLPSGCTAPTDAPQFSCAPTEVGTFHVTVEVEDGAHATAIGQATLNVTAASSSFPLSNLPPILGLPAFWGYVLVAGLVVAVLLALGIGARRRRAQRPPTAPAPWSGPVAPADSAADPGRPGVPPR